MTSFFQPIFRWADVLGVPHLAAAFALTLVLVLLVHLAFVTVLPVLARRSRSNLDDQVLALLERPTLISAVLVGGMAVYVALQEGASEPHAWVRATFATVAILYWSIGLSRSADTVLSGLASSGAQSLVQARTLPLMLIASKVIVGGGGVYAFCVAWDLDLTAWAASAGIMGIAVGFAAKDTLSNLFAGLFILVDAPYRIGDYLVLETGERGHVTDIGMRTTRLMTRDDIQIIVPNAIMANSKIINESGGPSLKHRIRCRLSVAYGSDVDQVRAMLMSLAEHCTELALDPPPRVRFRALGDSGLDFELMGWIEDSSFRGRVLDSLYTDIYKQFAAAGIEIPYPKHDVYLHQAVPEDGEPAQKVGAPALTEGVE